MPRCKRSEQFVASEICVVHAIQRCVRRAFLTGVDPETGKNFETRRDWIRRRLELLAAVFGIDVLTYAILSNHMHVILRSRPDVVKTWSDKNVAERWLRLFPGRRLDEHLGVPTETDIAALAKDKKRIAVVRSRLSDISWFMKSLCEPIARRANREDECTGHFWEGRFKAQRLMDEAAVLACSMYVDLNPVRARIADSPETSVHTSAYDRIQARKGKVVPSAANEFETPALTAEEASLLIRTTPASQLRRESKAFAKSKSARVSVTARDDAAKPNANCPRTIKHDAWLAPLRIDERSEPGPQASPTGIRASDKGFLAITADSYLNLLDWTGRQGRDNKRGKIAKNLEPILERIGVSAEMWTDLVWNFKRHFGRSAGSPASLKAEATRVNRDWLKGHRGAAQFFKQSE